MGDALNPRVRVAIYIRVSTKLQEKKYSLEAQEFELTRYAESQGWEIVSLFRDVESGGKLNKEGLDNLLDCVEDGLVDIVLCIDQDRLSRLDTLEWEYLKDILRKHNVKIAEPGRITDLENEDDEFWSDFKNLIARREKRAIVRRMMRGKRQYTRKGKVWGKQPEEYSYDSASKTISINEDRAWIIPFIDDLYLNKGYSTKRIAEELNKISSTATGKEWTPVHVQAKLKRKSYHGTLVKKFKGEVIEVPNVYPLLRSEEDYNKIQALLKENYNRKPAEPHFLRDVDIRCANCGRVISVKKGKTYGRKEGQEYDVWLLQHLMDYTDGICKVNPYINTKRIEKPLIEAVKGILQDEKTAQSYIDSGFDETELKTIDSEMKKLIKSKQSFSQKMDRLLALYLDGTWDKDTLDKQRAALDQDLKRVNTILDSLKKKRDLIQNKQLNYDTVVSFLGVAKNFDTLLEEYEKQRLIGGLFPSATLDAENNVIIMHGLLPGDVTVDFRIPIESTEEMQHREMMENAKKRYDEAQEYLYKHPGITHKELEIALKSNYSTLKKYQEWFGPFKGLAPNKQSPEVREEHIRLIREALKFDPKASGRKLEEMTGINRKRIYRLISEEGLRS